MKKPIPLSILILGALLFLCTLLSGQPGIKAGISASSFNYKNSPEPRGEFDVDLRPYLGYDIEWVQLGKQTPLFSPYLSAFYTLPVTGRLSIRPELGFIQKGVDFSQSDFERIVYKVRISYLEMPLSIAYSFLKKEKFRSELYVGGYGAVKIHAIKKTASGYTPTETTTLRNAKGFETGIHVGFNLKYKMAEGFIFIDLKTFAGLSNAFDLLEDQVKIYREVQKVRNSGFLISIGYEF